MYLKRHTELVSEPINKPQEVLVKRITALYLVVSQPTAGGSQYNDLASPLTMASIDKKIDDGVARTGKFQAYRAYASVVGNCITAVLGDYSLTETTDSRMAEFVIDK